MFKPSFFSEEIIMPRLFPRLVADDATNVIDHNLNPTAGGNVLGVFNPVDKP